jgi:NAD(P)-dependent dehydrogenase (short-subunit alcohol dehydrogenase family)
VTSLVSLDGRRVLITGAAAGLGRGLALACADAGAHVLVTSRGDNGNEVVATIEERGGEATWLRCDVTDEASVRAAVDAAGHLHAVVHNATSRESSTPHRIEDVTDEQWDEHVAVSLRGARLLAVAAHEPLAASGSGRFVVMSSASGITGTPRLPAYGVVKAALRGFARSLAQEWAQDGITVNALAPLAESDAMVAAAAKDPTLRPRLAASIPLGRLGDAEADIGPPLVFFLSEGSRYVTGQTLLVDGGKLMNL